MGSCLAWGWVRGWPHPRTLCHTCPHQADCHLSLPGVAISTYAKYCYHKLQKAALTGAKKVQMLPGEAGQGKLLLQVVRLRRVLADRGAPAC